MHLIDIADKAVHLVPHTLPTWPVNRNLILRLCLIKYDSH